MKHLNLKIEKLEERIAPGGVNCGPSTKTHQTKTHQTKTHASKSK